MQISFTADKEIDTGYRDLNDVYKTYTEIEIKMQVSGGVSNFLQDLGLGYSTGDEIDCYFPTNILTPHVLDGVDYQPKCILNSPDASNTYILIQDYSNIVISSSVLVNIPLQNAAAASALDTSIKIWQTARNKKQLLRDCGGANPTMNSVANSGASAMTVSVTSSLQSI